MTRVSIIVPAFRAEPFLAETVASVFAQTWTDWELLIAEDGSPDGTLAIARNAAVRDPARVRVLRHPNGANRGVSATRNLALRHASGDLVAFLDADDVWLPQKLELQVAAMRAPQNELCWARASYIDAQSQPTTFGVPPSAVLGSGPRAAGDLYDGFLQRDVSIPTLTVMARTQTVLDAGGFPEGMRSQTEDLVTWARVLRRGSGHFVDEVLARYRVHPSSWTARQTVLTQAEADLEALLLLLRQDGCDGTLALALLREGRRSLSFDMLSWPARLDRFSSVLRELATHGGLTPTLVARAAQRRLERTRRRRGA